MAESVDSVVLQLEARLGDYNAKVAGAANATQQSLSKVNAAVAQTDKAFGQGFNNARISQQILQRVGRGVADQFAASGLSMQLFTTHLGELAEAGAYAGGSMGKFGAFLAGPWGVAATLAATAILPIIANLLKQGDTVDTLVEKLKEHAQKTRDSERAQAVFATTTDGVREALDANRKAQEALNLVNETAAEKTKKSAEAQRELSAATIDNAKAQLAAAQATLHRLETEAPPIDETSGQQGSAISREAARIEDLKKTLADAEKELTDAENQIANATTAKIVDEVTGSREEQIRKKYDAQIDAARTLTTLEIQGAGFLAKNDAEKQKRIDAYNASLREQVKALQAASDAEVKAPHPSGQRYSNDQSGRDLDAAGAASIARAAGLQVNSSTRTYAQQSALYNAWVAAGKPASNPVARPGTSAHEGVNGRWALDIQLGDGVTPALLRKVFGAEGVTLTKVLKEQGHYHIEGKQSQETTDAEKAADAAQKKTEQEEKQYNTAVARLSLERTLQDLRSTGDALDAEIADQMQSNFEIESQFPQQANETNDAYRERLKLLKDIANATIAAKYADKGSLIGKNDPTTAELGKQIAKGVEAEAEAKKRADEALQQQREDQVRTLAGLYQDLFTGGTKSIWKDFKSIGLQVITELLARFTIAKLGGGGGGFSFGDALGQAIGHALPGFGGSGVTTSSAFSGYDFSTAGFASGGSMRLGGRGGTDQNMLSLNGQPLARVSAGEILNIANPRLAPAGGASGPIVIEVHAVEGQMFETRVAGIADGRAVRVVQVAAPSLTQAAVNETFRQGGRPRL